MRIGEGAWSESYATVREQVRLWDGSARGEDGKH
jgi:hypothetical protein